MSYDMSSSSSTMATKSPAPSRQPPPTAFIIGLPVFIIFLGITSIFFELRLVLYRLYTRSQCLGCSGYCPACQRKQDAVILDDYTEVMEPRNPVGTLVNALKESQQHTEPTTSPSKPSPSPDNVTKCLDEKPQTRLTKNSSTWPEHLKAVRVNNTRVKSKTLEDSARILTHLPHNEVRWRCGRAFVPREWRGDWDYTAGVESMSREAMHHLFESGEEMEAEGLLQTFTKTGETTQSETAILTGKEVVSAAEKAPSPNGDGALVSSEGLSLDFDKCTLVEPERNPEQQLHRRRVKVEEVMRAAAQVPNTFQDHQPADIHSTRSSEFYDMQDELPQIDILFQRPYEGEPDRLTSTGGIHSTAEAEAGVASGALVVDQTTPSLSPLQVALKKEITPIRDSFMSSPICKVYDCRPTKLFPIATPNCFLEHQPFTISDNDESALKDTPTPFKSKTSTTTKASVSKKKSPEALCFTKNNRVTNSRGKLIVHKPDIWARKSQQPPQIVDISDSVSVGDIIINLIEGPEDDHDPEEEVAFSQDTERAVQPIKSEETYNSVLGDHFPEEVTPLGVLSEPVAQDQVPSVSEGLISAKEKEMETSQLIKKESQGGALRKPNTPMTSPQDPCPVESFEISQIKLEVDRSEGNQASKTEKGGDLERLLEESPRFEDTRRAAESDSVEAPYTYDGPRYVPGRGEAPDMIRQDSTMGASEGYKPLSEASQVDFSIFGGTKKSKAEVQSLTENSSNILHPLGGNVQHLGGTTSPTTDESDIAQEPPKTKKLRELTPEQKSNVSKQKHVEQQNKKDAGREAIERVKLVCKELMQDYANESKSDSGLCELLKSNPGPEDLLKMARLLTLEDLIEHVRKHSTEAKQPIHDWRDELDRSALIVDSISNGSHDAVVCLPPHDLRESVRNNFPSQLQAQLQRESLKAKASALKRHITESESEGPRDLFSYGSHRPVVLLPKVSRPTKVSVHVAKTLQSASQKVLEENVVSNAQVSSSNNCDQASKYPKHVRFLEDLEREQLQARLKGYIRFGQAEPVNIEKARRRASKLQRAANAHMQKENTERSLQCPDRAIRTLGKMAETPMWLVKNGIPTPTLYLMEKARHSQGARRNSVTYPNANMQPPSPAKSEGVSFASNSIESPTPPSIEQSTNTEEVQGPAGMPDSQTLAFKSTIEGLKEHRFGKLDQIITLERRIGKIRALKPHRRSFHDLRSLDADQSGHVRFEEERSHEDCSRGSYCWSCKTFLDAIVREADYNYATARKI